MSCNQTSRQRLIENITILWTLNEIPEKPKYNTSSREDNGARQLTLERERQLADSFAFISARTDNRLHVMAVSVEEDADGNGITIRLASNTGDLSDTKEALTGIAKTLEKASTRGTKRLPEVIAFTETEHSRFTDGDKAGTIDANCCTG